MKVSKGKIGIGLIILGSILKLIASVIQIL